MTSQAMTAVLPDRPLQARDKLRGTMGVLLIIMMRQPKMLRMGQSGSSHLTKHKERWRQYSRLKKQDSVN